MDRPELPALPRSKDDDYSPTLLRERLEIASRAADHGLAHIAGLAVDPHSARGNVENMIGFAPSWTSRRTAFVKTRTRRRR